MSTTIDVHAILRSAEEAKSARAAQMPTEQDCFRVWNQTYLRLKEIGWNDAVYCPKDGSVFMAIEPGMSNPCPCVYHGEWPKGSWWYLEAGDMWPARPTMFRLMTEAEGKDR